MRPIAVLVVFMALMIAPTTQAAPRVVASVPPVHGLVSAVMAEAGKPHLLIPGNLSPHEYALRPSDARALSDAEVVFTVGAGLEAGLAEVIGTLAPKADQVALGELSGMQTLPLSEDHAGHAGEAEAGASIDPHLWLDPEIAIAWLDAIATALGRADPDRASQYRANAVREASRIEALAAEIEAQLAPVRGRDYAVFHDAYRYFERRFGLGAAASLASGEGDMPGARGLAGFRERLAGLKDPCLFAEPQQDSAQVRSLARDTGARLGVLDPLGAEIAPGPDFYPALLRALAGGFRECLAAEH